MNELKKINLVNRIKFWILLFWIGSCTLIAIYGLSQSFGGKPEMGLAPVVLLFGLTSPLGFIAQVVIVYLIQVISDADIGLTGHIFIYSTMILVGYLQWFVLVPKIYRSTKNRLMKMRKES